MPPFRPVPADAPRLIRALDQAAREHPLDRKVIVATARGVGRELLRTLARLRGGWTGFVVETPRPFALQLAMAPLAERGLRVLDELEEEALVDEALDAALAPQRAGSAYAHLAGGVGFRKAIRSAVAGLRLAGVTPEQLASGTAFADRAKQGLLIDVLEGIQAGLVARRGLDVAGVLTLAAAELDRGAPLPCERVFLLPGLRRRGVSGGFVHALQKRGAVVLPTDPVVGLDVPGSMVWSEGEVRTPRTYLSAPELAGGMVAETAGGGSGISLFRAAGIQEEIREVLRRVMASGRRFDEVEILTPDPAVYGPALHALAARLGIGVTFAVGLPVERTRPGRAVAAYLRWIGDDFPSAEIRRLLESDDLKAPGEFGDVDPPRLARRLRQLRVGWGRERYPRLLDAALDRLAAHPLTPRGDETPDELASRAESTHTELEALRALTRYLLRHTPHEIPRRLELHPKPVAPAALARGLGRFLRLVPTRCGSVDDTARERLLRVLDRIEHTLTRPSAFRAALGVLEDHLEIRVPAPRAEGKAPWLSDGGSLHLSDLEHGGLSGRPLTFIVGMDAGRFPGGDQQDPLLLDQERRALSSELPTSLQRLEEHRFGFAALWARLTGEVVLSYPAWDATEARVLAPSPVLLQAYRLMTGDAARGFDDLHAHLGAPTSRLPRSGDPIDQEDVWLGALLAEDHLLEGVDQVRAAFPRLDAGIRARRAWDRESGIPPGPHHGVLPARPGFDPRQSPETVLSASRLETLGTCPLRYFYRYVLHIKPPEDPTYEADRWLDSPERGSLLHRVFERLLREAREAGVELADDGFERLGVAILNEESGMLRLGVPPPSESTFERELGQLRVDTRCFVADLREHGVPWIRLERRFGPDEKGEAPAELQVVGGTIRIRGAVDRIDEAGPGGDALRVIDYKTGGFGTMWSRRTGIFHGGRRLQHVVYTLAVEALEGRPVESMEYHFPTQRGEGERKRFARAQLEAGPTLIARLLDAAARGHFVPSDEDSDCRYCDYQQVCRVSVSAWGQVSSPTASWAKEQREGKAEAYGELGAVRDCEED